MLTRRRDGGGILPAERGLTAPPPAGPPPKPSPVHHYGHHPDPVPGLVRRQWRLDPAVGCTMDAEGWFTTGRDESESSRPERVRGIAQASGWVRAEGLGA